MCRFPLSLLPGIVLSVLLAPYVPLSAAPASVTFDQSAQDVICYQFVEVTLRVDEPDVSNPFTDVSVEGQFALSGAQAVSVDGFCDNADGSLLPGAEARVKIRSGRESYGSRAWSVVWRRLRTIFW